MKNLVMFALALMALGCNSSTVVDGKSVRNGTFGQYEVVIAHVPLKGTWVATGIDVIQKIDAAVIPIGHPIRLVWLGVKETANGRSMKTFEVMVAEGEAIKAEDLPELAH